jgi:hypothetical protein
MKIIIIHFFTTAQQPPVGQCPLIIEASRSHSDTPHSVGLLWTSDQPVAVRPLPDNTQYSQQTNIHARDGIRTHNPRKRAAADPLLRPRGHWDRHYTYLLTNKIRFLSLICRPLGFCCPRPPHHSPHLGYTPGVQITQMNPVVWNRSYCAHTQRSACDPNSIT